MNGSAAPAMPAVPMHASPDGNGQAATATAQPARARVRSADVRSAGGPRGDCRAGLCPGGRKPAAGAPRDPIDEAPHAVWYVRPPTGGQYGPASGEIMRKWVGEGRVSGDSLIWREGWADWKTAASQFPEIGGGPGGASAPPPPAGITNPVITSPAAATGSPASPVRTYPRRRNNNSLAMVLVIVLTLAALGLLGLFFAVITWLG